MFINVICNKQKQNRNTEHRGTPFTSLSHFCLGPIHDASLSQKRLVTIPVKLCDVKVYMVSFVQLDILHYILMMQTPRHHAAGSVITNQCTVLNDLNRQPLV